LPADRKPEDRPKTARAATFIIAMGLAVLVTLLTKKEERATISS
jgi:hypothetical protein